MQDQKSERTLHRRQDKLSDVECQLDILNNGLFQQGELPRFEEKLKEYSLSALRPRKLEILQINLGKMCNQVCRHCHVDAGPDRKEIMTRAIMQECLQIIEKTEAHTLDLTGGAPEMNPNFRWFVEEAVQRGIQDIIVRSNLTIMRAHKKYYDLPEFFKRNKLHVVSSMPHWTRGKTDKQRGNGVFDQSIQALQELNAQGYGMPGSNLKLDLVYNPSGAFLPSNQQDLENDFKRALLEDFGIHFHQLLAITNLPISRFLEYLLDSHNYEDYMYTLVEAFNPAAVAHVMCTNTLSISWDGWLYDCDFNQMLDLKVANKVQHIKDYNDTALQNRNIVVSQHCYGCTAGAGSSCQGTVV